MQANRSEGILNNYALCFTFLCVFVKLNAIWRRSFRLDFSWMEKSRFKKKGFPVFQYPHFQIEVKCEILYVFYLRIKTYFQVKDFALHLVLFKKETSCNWEVRLLQIGYYNHNHNYNKIVKSDWLSTALISALIGQLNRTVRVMPK